MRGKLIYGTDTIFTANNTGAPFFSILDTAGSLIKLEKLNTTGGFYDAVTAITVDKVGSAYLGGFVSGTITENGHSYSSQGAEDFFIAKYGYPCDCITPAAAYTSSTQSPGTLSFSYTGTTANTDSLVWHFGDGQSLTVTGNFGTPISHTYTMGGSYTACVSVYGSCGQNTSCQQVVVSVGIEGLAAGNAAMLLYPNPASSSVTVQYSYGTEGRKARAVTVYDMTGREVRRQPLSEAQSTVTISTTDLAAGTYLVRLMEEGKTLQVQKLSIAR